MCRRTWLLLAVLVVVAGCGEVRLAHVFGDHMVLQREAPVPVWGWAPAGETVTVGIDGQVHETVADEGGRWAVRLEPMAAGGPYTLTVRGPSDVTLRDVLVGDVWVCSGQSNMEWPLASAANGEAEVAAADHPRMRLLRVPRGLAADPQADCEAAWTVCAPETAGEFSAVGYFFGRELAGHVGVPVGLIQSAYGGSPAEPWAPWAALAAHPDYVPVLDEVERLAARYEPMRKELQAEYEAALAEHEKVGPAFLANLPVFLEGLEARDRGLAEGWHRPEIDDAGWGEIAVPGFWQQAGVEALAGVRGIVWFRARVDVPAAWAGRDLILSLGAIDDADVTYFGGREVGRVGYETPRHWAYHRRYVVPGEAVRAGANVVAVRVTDLGGSGGLVGPASEMYVAPLSASLADAGSLPEVWRWRVGWTPEPGEIPRKPRAPADPAAGHRSPSAMYNAMIAPLVPYAMRGVIWYQGESNVTRAGDYRDLFTLLIGGWRGAWGQGEFPFLFVQLASLGPPPIQPQDHGWARLREAQVGALAVANTGMAVAIDVGDADDIHPRDKQTVGRRLALAARKVAYGEDVVHSGPVYEGMEVAGGRVRVHFRHVGGGLVARGGAIRQFAIAGADRQFVWAEARVEGETVVVWSDAVPAPVAVRYGWAQNPEGCNLYNREGLPASPFRTDDWPPDPDVPQKRYTVE